MARRLLTLVTALLLALSMSHSPASAGSFTNPG
jgi:hypothetical protein